MPGKRPDFEGDASASQRPFWLAHSTRSIFFFAIMLTAAGIYLAFKVPISVFPEANFPRIVIAIDNGVTPVEQMEVTITRPIEEAVNSVPGLDTVRSTTSRGSAEVSLFFDWNVDMVTELQLVDAALSTVQQTLPSTVHIAARRLTFASFPILGYSLTSDTVPLTRLWEIANYDLKPPLNRVAGVSAVLVQGGQVPEFHVVPNLALMQQAGVTIPDLAAAIETSNIVDSPGLYEANHQLILGLVGAQVHDLDGIRQLVVKTTTRGAPVRVADVATVENGTLPVYTAVTANGKTAVLLSLLRQPTSNTVAVADAVAAQVTALRKKLPPGVKLDVFYDQSQLVRDSIASVRDAIFIGLILACVILFLFLRDWTSSLIAGLVIPVTICVTILILWLMGESFNLMTLGGLAAAIGLVIDDAIVVVENIAMHRDAGESRADAVRKALGEITVPLIGSTITPVVVFLPLVSVSGVTGLFFRALAVTMTAALLTSLVLALTWTPGLSYVLLRRQLKHASTDTNEDTTVHENHDHRAGKLLTRVLSVHRRVLGWAFAKPLWTGAICLALAAGTWAGYQSLGSDLLPLMDEGGFILDYIMPAGSSLAETNRVLDHVERILHSLPEVENTSRRTGLQLGYAAVTEANTGDFTVKLKSKRSRSVWDAMDDVRAEIKKTEPELDIEITQVLQDDINDLSNAPEPIQVNIYSNDELLLTQLGPRVGDAIGKVPGVVDVENGIENTISGPATNFQIDPTVASRLGFTPEEVSQDATSILDGIPISAPLIANGRQYTIRVRLGDEHRASLDAIRDTVFNSATGHTASLGSLAAVEQLPPQNEIRRENLQRLIAVTANLEGSDLGTAIARVKQTVAGLHLPASVRAAYGGTYQEQQKSFHDLLQVLLLAFALVFGVLLAEFRNFEAPLAILTSSVLSIAGVILALLITGTTFNVSSFMGLIMVIGIVAKNGILLLDAGEKFRFQGATARDAMLHAAQRRLRPIVMTALAAICGMLPLAFAIGAGSQMLQPLAIAVIGGICIGMVLSLVVTPLVYYLLTQDRSAVKEEA
ncbi:MAG TPA: efflux RND transporter permease subunit [Terracidiphilus sp.]|jgi:CzcA family heavy metal efflux pump|nr:efflux RND transporter permease subunit [Terracidiphilus sp.]